MNELTILLLSGIITLFTELCKKFLPNINPLFYVAILACIGGAIYAFIVPIIPIDTLNNIGKMFAYAVAYYNILKQLAKIKLPQV